MVLEFSDTENAAVPAATSILVRQSEQGVETLLLRRSEALQNMPGLWVFPGGKVDPEDAGSDEERCAGAAAVRELQEEAGLAVEASALVAFSHWLTPPVVKRRFSTWFFLTSAPTSQTVQVDGEEMVEHRWLGPAAAIAEHHAGRLPLTPPTLVSLHELALYESVDTLLRSIASRAPPRFFPKVLRQDDHMVFLYPGDAAYETGDLSALGPVHRTLAREGIFQYFPQTH